MKKEIKREDEVITRGILKQELKAELKIQLSTELRKVRGEFKREHNKLRDELHSVEYRLDTKINSRFNELKNILDDRFDYIITEMKKHTDTFQKLADKVIGTHSNFESESASIKQNYNQLETRVKKVEEVVFPGSI